MGTRQRSASYPSWVAAKAALVPVRDRRKRFPPALELCTLDDEPVLGRCCRLARRAGPRRVPRRHKANHDSNSAGRHPQDDHTPEKFRGASSAMREALVCLVHLGKEPDLLPEASVASVFPSTPWKMLSGASSDAASPRRASQDRLA